MALTVSRMQVKSRPWMVFSTSRRCSSAIRASSSQTVTSTISETVDLTKLASRGNLEVGFYDGAVAGNGFTSMTFQLTVDGTLFVNKNVFHGQQEALPLYVFSSAASGTPADVNRAWAAAFTLILIVVLLYVIARLLTRRDATRR